MAFHMTGIIQQSAQRHAALYSVAAGSSSSDMRPQASFVEEQNRLTPFDVNLAQSIIPGCPEANFVSTVEADDQLGCCV